MVTIVALIMIFVGNVKAELGEDKVTIKGPLTTINIAYKDIEKLEFREDLDIGSRSFGVETLKGEAGTFSNDEFGKYKLCAYKSVDDYIVIYHKNGVAAFNLSSVEETREFYELLKEKL